MCLYLRACVCLHLYLCLCLCLNTRAVLPSSITHSALYSSLLFPHSIPWAYPLSIITLSTPALVFPLVSSFPQFCPQPPLLCL
ncbi:MAG: hypothetical protein J3R72DRAFT_429523 [Linnemannia gamsii]|nr:MAG: hypothetical protein J3R72DRAFT_429523 [Linnemannia gamsii]